MKGLVQETLTNMAINPQLTLLYCFAAVVWFGLVHSLTKHSKGMGYYVWCATFGGTVSVLTLTFASLVKLTHRIIKAR